MVIIEPPDQSDKRESSGSYPDNESNQEREGRFFATVIYILLGLGTVALLPWIAAAIIYYVKVEDVRGTIWESHFRWQIRTFWFSILYDSLAVLLVILTLGIGLLVAWPVFVFIHFWVLYRIIKGFIRLGERREI